MNNIELNQLKQDIQLHLGYSQEDVEKLGALTDNKLSIIKRDIERIKSQKDKSTQEKHRKMLLEKKLKESLKIQSKDIIDKKIKHYNDNPKKVRPNTPYYFDQPKPKKVPVSSEKKPKILFISDVKGWAWWNKSLILKKYLSDEFDIDIKCVLGDGATPMNKINQTAYDLYFTYGFSYIEFLRNVNRNKKVTGVTAHRPKHVIFPKMRMAEHVHANSIMLLNELYSMGFEYAHYVPNGVDETLFKPFRPIREDGELIVGHVGKKCAKKNQESIILPAIKKANTRSHTNLRTWQNKIPLNEMPRTYNEMDLFIVASDEDGTPNPALEAAACGRPIISNKIGNMPEFIIDGYNGFIVPKKIDSYVDKINYFKHNRQELIRMGENARKTVLEGWTWKIQSEHYRNMFNSIFERK